MNIARRMSPRLRYEHDHGRSGMMIMLGDTFHNFVDGIIIAAAFLTDMHLGIVTALAIIAHEIPQEVGDFAILLHSGYSKMRAFKLNLISSFASVAGRHAGIFHPADHAVVDTLAAGAGGGEHDLCGGGRPDSWPA